MLSVLRASSHRGLDLNGVGLRSSSKMGKTVVFIYDVGGLGFELLWCKSKKKFPLLLRALALPNMDAGIRADVVETLLEAVASSPPIEKSKTSTKTTKTEDTVLSEHAASLARTMLNLAKPGPVSTPRLRLAALRLLGALPRVVRYDVLHPSKADVLRGLDTALDDPKKSVRRRRQPMSSRVRVNLDCVAHVAILSAQLQCHVVLEDLNGLLKLHRGGLVCDKRCDHSISILLLI